MSDEAVVQLKFFDFPSVVPYPLSQDEIVALERMFQENGWRVFMRIRKFQAQASARIGLSLSAPEEQRIMHRAVYHALLGDLLFQDTLSGETTKAAEVTREEAEQARQEPEYEFVPIDKESLDKR